MTNFSTHAQHHHIIRLIRPTSHDLCFSVSAKLNDNVNDTLFIMHAAWNQDVVDWVTYGTLSLGLDCPKSNAQNRVPYYAVF
jgi:hypothetical protein